MQEQSGGASFTVIALVRVDVLWGIVTVPFWRDRAWSFEGSKARGLDRRVAGGVAWAGVGYTAALDREGMGQSGSRDITFNDVRYSAFVRNIY